MRESIQIPLEAINGEPGSRIEERPDPATARNADQAELPKADSSPTGWKRLPQPGFKVIGVATSQPLRFGH
jgi:hypothetical protein